MSELPIGTIKAIIFGDGMGLGEPDVDDDAPDPMQQFILRNQVNAALGKSTDASCVLDLSVPQDDVDGDDPLYKAPRIIRGVSGALRKSEGKAFIRCLAKIREVFAGHDELMHEAIETVTKARDDERAAMLAQIAATQ